MANEVSVRVSLQVKNGNLVYQSQPNAFSAGQLLAAGPTPGSILVGVNHTVVSLSQLTSLGWAIIQNIDATSTICWGIYNQHYGIFVPVGDLLPGESALLRLSSLLGRDEVPGTGTGAEDPYANVLAVKSLGGQPAYARVDAFNN